ncbi:DNA helicase [Bacteroidia bacterium]|nr:DNA helicase [Bacteroidia bacterium]
MNSSFLSDLNDEQVSAVQHLDGPLMIIAGAGSGKTRTLTYRIANLLNHQIEPFHILALTFTNKAAREMRERIFQLIGTEAKQVWMGTFHSIFARILRIDGALLGYTKNFTIYDTDDCKSLIRTIVKGQNLDQKVYSATHVLHRISSAKSNLISPQDYIENADLLMQDSKANRPMLGELYAIYNAQLKRQDAMDFDDLLFNTNLLFRDFPEVLSKYQHRFEYILVDEYQDTNYAQYLIIKKIAAGHHNLCVVGDDAQSIYAFRGANIQNILNFKTDYPDFKTYKLEQNYRSTKMIVAGANSVIAHNKDQIHKDIWTTNPDGDPIHLWRSDSDKAEGLWVARTIFDQRMQTHGKNSDFAVLYRTNNQSRTIEDALRHLNIPYRIYGGQSFYQRKEIKDLLAYFRVVVNLNDQEALLRIINYPARGIGQTTIDRLRILADEHQTSIWNVLNTPAILAKSDLKSNAVNKLSDFVVMIKSLNIQVATTDAFDLATQILNNSGLKQALKEEDTLEAEGRLRNIEELINAVKDFTLTEQELVDESTGEIIFVNNALRTLDEFILNIALLSDADTDDPNDNDKVVLMTIHAAKGLEFPNVFVVGIEENLFPSAMSVTNRADLEEERRLFYVAITRAMNNLYLSFADSRFVWGQYSFCEPSRFLSELNPKYFDRPDILQTTNALRVSNEPQYSEPSFALHRNPTHISQRTAPLQRTPVQTPASVSKNLKPITPTVSQNSSASTNTVYNVGMVVRHSKFGKGTVIEIDSNSEKIIVNFDESGNKTLLTKFAKLDINNE